MSINVFFVVLVVLVCANVALLLFARAAARETEIAVRTALGAGRARIIGQLFAEALALGSLAAAAGLAAAGFILRWWLSVARAENGGLLPFWFGDALAPATLLYAATLTVAGSVVAGVVPALKVTGRRVEPRLRQATGGGGGLRFGGIWTAVIITQVAVTVAFPATAWFVRRSVVEIRSLDPGFPAAQYLSAELEMDPEFAAASSPAEIRAVFPEARFRKSTEELIRRLHLDDDVLGATFTHRLPLTHHPAHWIEAEDEGSTGVAHERGVASASVAVDFFDVLGAPILAGRGFRQADVDSGARVAIVNQSFVDRVLGGRNAIGRRLRELPENRADGTAGPWLEIIGVVRDLGLIVRDPFEPAGFYRPVAPGSVRPAHIVVHVRRAPESFAPTLHAIAAGADPTLRLQQVAPLNEVDRTLWLEFNFLFKLLVVVSAIALLLSLAGIYSVLSFTVSQRTREIGIRAALGADRLSILAAIFRRPLVHVGLGVVAGMGLTTALAVAVDGRISAWGSALIALYGAVMMAVCLISCIVPTRRALSVDPTEALRMDA